MEADGIVPALIPEPPSSKVVVVYPNGKEVQFGQELAPIDVKDEPKVSWEADPNKFYTLIMIDPDAPSRENPTFGEVKHWLVVNIPGKDVGSGETIAPYVGSGPPQGTGLHRYIFLVYEQKEKTAFEEPKSLPNSREHRLKWSFKNFVKKYGLGKAFAGNYYNAQWDPYVEEFRKKMTN